LLEIERKYAEYKRINSAKEVGRVSDDFKVGVFSIMCIIFE